MEKKFIYKPDGRPKYIKSGGWTWSQICPAHLPMTLQKLGYKIDEIRGFKKIK